MKEASNFHRSKHAIQGSMSNICGPRKRLRMNYFFKTKDGSIQKTEKRYSPRSGHDFAEGSAANVQLEHFDFQIATTVEHPLE